LVEVEKALLNQTAILCVTSDGFLVTLYGSQPSSMRIRGPNLSFQCHKLHLKQPFRYDLSILSKRDIAITMDSVGKEFDTHAGRLITRCDGILMPSLLHHVRNVDPKRNIGQTDLYLIHNSVLVDLFKAQQAYVGEQGYSTIAKIGFAGIKGSKPFDTASRIAKEGFDVGCYNNGNNLYGAGGAYLCDSIDYIVQNEFINKADPVIMAVWYLLGCFFDGTKAKKQQMGPGQHSWRTCVENEMITCAKFTLPFAILRF